MKAATTRIQANFRGKKERQDPMAESNVRKKRAENDPSVKAERYLKEHDLMALFELMGESLMRSRPEEPKAFLVQMLTELKDSSNPTSPIGNFFVPEDVDTLHSMYDASRKGLTPAQCREALDAMGLEKIKVPAGIERFDKGAFLQLVDQAA